MASILIATNAGRAHVSPCVPAVRELLRRGHTVYWYTGARHAATVAASGARFVEPQAGEFLDMDTVEQDFPELATMKPHQRGPWWVERVFVDPIPGQYQDLRKAAAEFGIDVVLADSTMAAASLLHEIDGLLWATLSMAPMAIPDPDVPPFGMGWLPGHSPLHRLRNRLVAGIGDKLVMKAPLARMNAIRAELGLPPVPSTFAANATPYLYLQASVPGFEYPRSALPPQVRFVGPLYPDSPGATGLPQWWPELAGRTVVLVTQGTSATAPEQLIQPALQGLRELDALVVCTSPRTGELGELPPNVRTAAFLPYDLLMPQLAAVVTNGGYGTVHAALRHGVPLVVAGGTEDKPEVCARVAWSGAGIRLQPSRITPQRVAEAVRTVLAEPSYRTAAGSLAADIAASDAPAAIADALEQLVRTRQPVLSSQAG